MESKLIPKLRLKNLFCSLCIHLQSWERRAAERDPHEWLQSCQDQGLRQNNTQAGINTTRWPFHSLVSVSENNEHTIAGKTGSEMGKVHTWFPTMNIIRYYKDSFKTTLKISSPKDCRDHWHGRVRKWNKTHSYVILHRAPDTSLISSRAPGAVPPCLLFITFLTPVCVAGAPGGVQSGCLRNFCNKTQIYAHPCCGGGRRTALERISKSE